MLISWDERRDLEIPGNEAKTIAYAVDHWIHLAKQAIARSGRFAVALSGGSTPKAIFENLAQKRSALDWSRVWLFWSDERAVSPDNPESNYHMAMNSGLRHLPIVAEHIFRMKAEERIEENALAYEKLIQSKLGKPLFDLVMLGVGEDGHTASLFPDTHALHIKDHLVSANYVAQKNTWRMSFTFRCINESQLSVIYALGANKAEIIQKVLNAKLPSPWPASFVGTKEHKALWILDEPADQKMGVDGLPMLST